MGSGQSSQIQEEPTEMETLYEILGVEKNASDSELKRAWKKQALLLHPDRNFDNAEEATRKFARIQAAYDVLSDPQERAWYDSHGSESGRTGADDPECSGGHITSIEELKKYFDPTYYQNISQRKNEFYDLVGQLFTKLAEEEGEAALDLDLEEPLLPALGHDLSPWRDVKSFYDSWTSFSTIKTFAWEDIYRAWDAPDRRSRRAMDVRNKKIRDAAKKEFNETVRSLAAIIKQKDPRVRAQVKKSKTKPQSSASKEQARRARSEQATKRQTYEEQAWAVPETDGNQGIQEFQDCDNSGDEVVNLFECIVCDKTFKTNKQLLGHEASKKHIKNLRQLKKDMRKEGVDLGFDQENDKEDDKTDLEPEEDTMEQESDDDESDTPDIDTPDIDSHDKDSVNNIFDKHLNRKKSIDSVVDAELSGDKHSNRKMSIDSVVDAESSGENDSSNVNNDQMTQDPTLEELLAQLEGTRVNNKMDRSEQSTKKSGRAKQKRTKKEASNNNFANMCGVCQTEFSSRNKLFEHVKRSGHAVPVKGKKL